MRNDTRMTQHWHISGSRATTLWGPTSCHEVFSLSLVVTHKTWKFNTKKTPEMSTAHTPLPINTTTGQAGKLVASRSMEPLLQVGRGSGWPAMRNTVKLSAQSCADQIWGRICLCLLCTVPDFHLSGQGTAHYFLSFLSHLKIHDNARFVLDCFSQKQLHKRKCFARQKRDREANFVWDKIRVLMME